MTRTRSWPSTRPPRASNPFLRVEGRRHGPRRVLPLPRKPDELPGRLDAVTLGTPLSYSSYRTYAECPLRWKFLYIDRLPETPRGYFTFGRVVHSVLEELVRPLLTPGARRLASGEAQRTLDDWHAGGPSPSSTLPMTREELLAAYDAAWSSEGYGSPEEEERYRTLGRDLLLRYYQRFLSERPHPVAVEEHLEARWDGIPIHGYIDRIDRTVGRWARDRRLQDVAGTERGRRPRLRTALNLPGPRGEQLHGTGGGPHPLPPPIPHAASRPAATSGGAGRAPRPGRHGRGRNTGGGVRTDPGPAVRPVRFPVTMSGIPGRPVHGRDPARGARGPVRRPA